MYSKLISAGLTTFASLGLSFVRPANANSIYTQTVESQPGLLAYYQFSGNTNSSVNGYTGTLNPGASIGGPNSGPPLADDPANRALELNGTTGNSLQSNLLGGISSSGTILAWINLAQLPSTAGHIFYIAGESAFGKDFDLQVETDNTIKFYTEAGPSVATGDISADLGKWIFVAASFKAGSDRNIYIDGVLQNSNHPNGHTDSGGRFTVGYSNVFPGRAFNGAIDEVAIYNTELDQSQISAIYNSAGTPASTPLPSAAWGGLVLLIGAAVVKGGRASLRNSLIES